MTFSRKEVEEASKQYFNGDSLAAEVFASKYALQNLKGEFFEKTPVDMHKRLAREFARIEKKYPNPMTEEEIFQSLSSWEIVPQGSPMSGIGNPFQVQSISNCFVIDAPEDSYGGIFRADQEQAQIMKRRGGVGSDISEIRPKGLPAANAARTTAGIAAFMERFSNTTREVAQNGRRGALMLTLNVHHPEVDTFIEIKKDRKKVTGANISLKVTDEFMTAVKNDALYVQRWPVNSRNPVVSRTVNAREIWNKMMEAAWDSAEPGVLFWDSIIRGSPADCYAELGFRTQSTNPCGELPLPKYDSCRLILINLIKFVKNAYTSSAFFDVELFREKAIKAQRLMDDMIDLELEMIDKIISKVKNDPEHEDVKRAEIDLWTKIKNTASKSRRTGLGITALGDMLAAMGVQYGSDKAIHLTEHVYQTLAVSSYTSSITMAQERGAFPIWDKHLEKDNEFIKRILGKLDKHVLATYEKFGRRNIANLTTSPAGSVSVETQTTSGFEPTFMIDYKRRRKINANEEGARVDYVDQSGDTWIEYKVFHHGHSEWARVNGKDPDKDLKQSPYFGSTANEIDWQRKVQMQAAAQKWIDHSISNTTNLPKTVTVQDVSDIYMRAWESGCKGVTVYRDGSRAGVLVSSEEKKDPRESDSISETHAPKRPNILPCTIHHANISGDDCIFLFGILNGKPYEVFFGLSSNISLSKNIKKGMIAKTTRKNGVASYDLLIEVSSDEDKIITERFEDIVKLFDNPNHGAFTRTLSTALRHGVPVQYIVEQLRKDRHSDMWSFAAVVARLLSKNFIKDGTKSTGEKKCFDCSSTNLAYQEGCVSCLDCGSSKCS